MRFLTTFVLVILVGLFAMQPAPAPAAAPLAVVKFTLNNQNIKSQILSVDPTGREIVAIWECGRRGVSGDIWNFGRMGVSVEGSIAGPYGDGRWDGGWFRLPFGSSCVEGDTGSQALPFEASPGDTVRWRIEGEVYRPLHLGDLRLIYEGQTVILN